MKHRCLDFPELERILDLDPADPRRLSVEACPRCRARMLSLLEFLSDTTEPAGARLEEAAARLRRAFEAELPAAHPPQTTEAPKRRAAWPGRARPWFARPAWALAASTAVFLIVIGGRQFLRTPETVDRLREAGHPAAGEPVPVLLPPEPRSQGEIVLRWHPVTGATAYAVRLLDADLAELTRLGPVADTLMVLGPESIPAGSRTPILGWQVLALREGSEMATSAIGTLRAP